jgi:hypothetical protein
VLAKLGALEALLGQGVATKELSYFNVHGQRIWTEPRGLFAGFRCPSALYFTGHPADDLAGLGSSASGIRGPSLPIIAYRLLPKMKTGPLLLLSPGTAPHGRRRLIC